MWANEWTRPRIIDNIVIQSWKLLCGWQNGTRQHYVHYLGVQQAMVSVHRPVHSKITVTCMLTWQTDRWRTLYTPANGFQSITLCQGGLFLSFAQTFSALIVWINCQNGVPLKVRLRVLSIMPSAYAQLSPLYLLSTHVIKYTRPSPAFQVMEGWAGPGNEASKTLYELYLNCVGNKKQNTKTSVSVVKKHCSHQKHCGGMGCAVVQQACS